MKETKHLLIVEDDPIIAQEIEFNLSDRGYTIAGVAPSSERAISILEKKKVDIALLDISIDGEINGIDLGHHINKHFQIPFVFLTSYSDKETINNVAQTSPYGYIVKPYKDSDLAPALEVAMARYRSTQTKQCPSMSIINAQLKSQLTKQEYKILQLIWDGAGNQDISKQLFVSINTTKSHVSSIFDKIDIRNKNELIVYLRNF